MDSVYSVVATIVGLFIFLQVFTMVLMTARLVKMRLWAPTFVTVAREDAAAELPFLDAARALLESEGFEYASTRLVRNTLAGSSMLGGYSDVYYHPGHDVHAVTCAAAIPTAQWPFDISLWNTYTDGTALLTVNGHEHLLITFPAAITVVDGYVPTFPLQLAYHLEQRAKRVAARTDPAHAEAISAAQMTSMFPDLVREGRAYSLGNIDGEPIYAVRLSTAIRAAWRIRNSMSRRKCFEEKMSPHGVVLQASPAALQVSEKHAFVRCLQAVNNLHAPRWFRWSAFAVSAALFVALGAWWWGMSAALVIGAVVALHEAGHWLAMRLAGFRDVQVFFVPGMGAATSGEKHDANPLTHLAVYLAGPVPGLLLGMAGVALMLFGQVDSAAWWYPTFVTAIVAALLINLANLLPLMPLDGGRVVDLFVMGRLPWFRFAFALVSGASLIGLGYSSGEKVIAGMGLLAFLALPHQYRMAKVSRDLLRQSVKAPFAAEDFVLSAARLFDFLAQPAYKSWTSQAKMGVGEHILPRFLGRLPSLKETVLGLCIYVACIGAPLALLVLFAVREPQGLWALLPPREAAPASVDYKDSVQTQRDRSAARLAAASDPAQRLKILGELVDEAREDRDDDEEQRLARLLYAATAPLAPPSLERAGAALKLANALRNNEDEQSALQAASLLEEADTALRLRLFTRDAREDALLLADVIDARIELMGTAVRLAMLQEIVDLRAAHWETPDHRLLESRTSLARALDAAGNTAQAESQLITAQEEAGRVTEKSRYYVDALSVDHGWFLMSNQRAQDAMQRIASGVHSHDRNATLLAAFAARSRGDWLEVKAHTLPLQVIGKAQSSSWILRFFERESFDLRAGLLLVEAERKLGNDDVADQLVADMREQYIGKKGGTPTCRFNHEYHRWRQGLADALHENERREFKCT